MGNQIAMLQVGSVAVEYHKPCVVGKLPVVVTLPILEDQKYLVERCLARYFTKHGFAVLIVRRQKIELTDGRQVNYLLEKAVADARSVLDWVGRHPDFNNNRIAVLGISLGGIIGAVLAAVDQRIQAAILALAGADLPSLLVRSREKGIVRRREECLKQKHMMLDELESELRRSIEFDPLFFSPHLDPEKILLVLARFDAVIPYENGLALRDAMQKKPETICLWSGHYTAILYLPYLRRAFLNFLMRKLVVPSEF